MQRSALCRSRRELSNAYLLAKFGRDTAENEPCKVCPIERGAVRRLDEAFADLAAPAGRCAELSELLESLWRLVSIHLQDRFAKKTYSKNRFKYEALALEELMKSMLLLEQTLSG